MSRAPFVIAVGGIDPTGGAGLARDAATALALGAAIHLVGTAWTRQSSAGVAAVEPRAPASVAAALRDGLLAAAGGVGGAAEAAPTGASCAVKIGMLATPAIASAIADILGGVGAGAGWAGPVVFDPVLAASAGGALFLAPEGGLAAALAPVFRAATLVTPNASEAGRLCARPVVTVGDAERAGRGLLALGARAVLVKGGHLEGADAIDVLVTPTACERIAASRRPGPAPRGAGCALATAIAVALARGAALPDAVRTAKAWLLGARFGG